MYKLYMAPGGCSRVPLIALEEIGKPYETTILRFTSGEQRSHAHRSINPKGTIPVLIVDGTPLSENVAIINYLAKAHPDAQLLPFSGDALGDSRILSDLAWCASGMHPIVTRLVLPDRYCDIQGGAENVWHNAATAMKVHFNIIERRLSCQTFWYEQWSIMDCYLWWVWCRVSNAGFNSAQYPAFCAHAGKMMNRESVRRAMAKEDEANQWLEAQGLRRQLPRHSWLD